MIIKNGLVFGTDCRFHRQNVEISDGIITDISEADISGSEEYDATDCYVIPGLVDIHLHAAFGYDFCDAKDKSIESIAQYELKNGITAICPTSMTFPEDKLSEIFRTIADFGTNTSMAEIVGINMEGPFISEKKKGAQNEKYIQSPDTEMFRRLQKVARDLIKILCIAPEMPCSMEVIRELKDEVCISLAHSDADYDTAIEAFENGACHVTHLFNAMNPFTHRNPGIIGAACDKENVFVELICDGVHIAPAAIRATFKMFGDDRIVMISDSMMATGLSDGKYELGGQEVIVNGNRATLADGTIAGSVTNLMDCVRNVVRNVGIPLETAVKCATINPSKSIGIFDRYGSIEVGKAGNIVILDKNLEIRHVIKA
ncbi:N-acetylglucosamine-6-phosphate deacetylase [Butyrivibrio sp. YAB3001]|uniref:N-acetylglucosamine-6-phosphate deacetylase n=1 Tax=Butyrivibrio sp. YAB3001 TaxID=1520812 RepID=UPI0008F61C4E|nr:N-acetylglucosamine-6-phosphate deacetylase [Butyrivibrio sp. YAB3001]SFC27388.1 N-acetylglucosamine-6-phosphate deacetylase [Butyrivibrio sp. YAB3001]